MKKATTPATPAKAPAVSVALELVGKAPRAHIEGMALVIDKNASLEDFIAVGKGLAGSMQLNQWLLGDWLNALEANYKKDYKTAVAATGLTYGTLKTYASVAASFKPEDRRRTLSFAHHQLLQGTKPEKRAELMDKAEPSAENPKGLSVKALSEITPKKAAKKKKETAEEKEKREIKESGDARQKMHDALAFLRSDVPAGRLAAWLDTFNDLRHFAEDELPALMEKAEKEREAEVEKTNDPLAPSK